MARSLLACAHSTVFRGLLAPFFLAGPECKGLEAASRVDLKNSRHSDCSDPIFHAGFPTGVIFGFYWGYLGIMEKKMETTILYMVICLSRSQHSHRQLQPPSACLCPCRDKQSSGSGRGYWD